MRRLAPLFIISAASLLTACGGGGGSDNSAGSPAGGQSTGSSTSLTGRFVDGPVSGLRYRPPPSNGRTNANGEFTYRQGETVSFFIGAVLIGQAPGAATITPFILTATPLEVAGNIATFLQTVDSDGDPANGIQVPAAMDGLTTGKSIDFRQTFSRFKVDAGVQALIAAGRSAGVWSGSRTLKDPFLALDALYSGLGISPAIKSISSTAFDTGGYGSVDSVVTKTYDAQGHVIREDTTNADGTPDAVTTFIYDANGVLTRLESTKSVGGPLDSAADFIYENGRLIRIDSRNASNTLIAQTKFTYTNGNLTKQEADTNADGTTDNTNDATGHLLTTAFDRGANGSVDDSDTYTYDANDNVTTQAHSSNGQVSLNITSTYDAIAYPTLILFAHPAASTSDFLFTYEYNPDGTLKTWKKILAPGSVDFSVNYNYTLRGDRAAAGWVQCRRPRDSALHRHVLLTNTSSTARSQMPSRLFCSRRHRTSAQQPHRLSIQPAAPSSRQPPDSHHPYCPPHMPSFASPAYNP